MNNKLRLNDCKTEFLIIGTEKQLSKVSVDEIKVGQTEVASVSSVRDLGMHLVRFSSGHVRSSD